MSAPSHVRGQSAVAPDTATNSSATPATRSEGAQRQRIRWFVAGHVGAVTLVHLLAAWVGDGWAPPPFPPDLTTAQRQLLLAPARPAPGVAAAAEADADMAPGGQPAPEVDAPWQRDTPRTAPPARTPAQENLR